MLDIIDPIESFRPNPDGQCLCGKKRIFKDCCGSDMPDREPPFGIVLKRNYLPAETCDKLVAFAKTKGAESDLAVFTDSSSLGDDVVTMVNKDRVSSKVDLASKQGVIDKWVGDIFHQFVAKRVKKKIRNFSTPDLMRYECGGYYKPHADSEMFDTKTGVWKKILDRDYSLLLYLNSEYEGGELHFEHFNFTYRPQKGDLLVFPSHHLYLHEAKMVKSGFRYVIVSWAAV
jgi:hypothetical protein